LAELRGLGEVAKELESRGGQIFAVSVDKEEDSAGVVNQNKLPFPILSDKNSELISILGIVHKGGGPDGGDIAYPAQFLFGRDGNLVWHFISRRIQGRVNPAEILQRIQTLDPPA
jgi:peroxiredoxin